jgi:cell division protein FtsB
MDVIALVAALGGVGALISALVAWRKAGSAIDQAESAARKTEVDALSGIVTTLQAENKRLCARVDEMEREQEADRELIERLRAQISRLQAENRQLRRRVAELERENRQLKGEVDA